jgi:hypothetical protein
VTVRLYSCIRNVLGCNLGRFSGSHDWGFSWFINLR